jgi:hypothetical protein
VDVADSDDPPPRGENRVDDNGLVHGSTS